MADFGLGSIAHIAPFVPDADPTSVAQRWKRWSDRFDNLLIALNITDNTRKKALLLHLAGESVYEVFEGLVIADVAEGADPNIDNVYLAAKRALDQHFNPQRNIEFERYTFHLAHQQPGETIDTYHARLRSLSKYCNFSNVDAEIKSHIVQTCTSTRLRIRALTDATLTLQALIDYGRSLEMTERQTKAIEEGHRVDIAPTHHTAAQLRQQSSSRPKVTPSDRRTTPMSCRNCGNSYPHDGGRMSCPAWGTECRGCGKYNHW